MKSSNYFIFLISILLISCQPKANEIPLKEINEHRKYQDKKGKDNVKQEYIELVNQNPNSAEALYLLARCESNKDESLILLDNALKINPEFYYALLSKGVIFHEKKDYDKAKELYLKCINIDNKNYLAYNNFFNLLIEISADVQNLKFKLELYKSALDNLKSASSSNGSDEVLRKEGKGYFASRIKVLESKINDLKVEIEQKYKCEKLSGYYEGNMRMGYALGGAGVIIREDCSCTYEYKVILPNGKIDGATENGELVNITTLNSSSVSCELDCGPRGGKYPFSWSSSGVVEIEGYNFRSVLYKK